jgi:lantibiotic modifying enzyme
MERLEATAAGRQSDIEAELADIGTGIDEIKKHVTAFEEQHNRSLVRDITHWSILLCNWQGDYYNEQYKRTAMWISTVVWYEVTQPNLFPHKL